MWTDSSMAGDWQRKEEMSLTSTFLSDGGVIQVGLSAALSHLSGTGDLCAFYSSKMYQSSHSALALFPSYRFSFIVLHCLLSSNDHFSQHWIKSILMRAISLFHSMPQVSRTVLSSAEIGLFLQRHLPLFLLNPISPVQTCKPRTDIRRRCWIPA